MQDLGDGDEGQPCPMKESSCVCKEEVDGRVSGTYLPEPVRPWRRRQQQSWYAAGPLLDRNATVGRGYGNYAGRSHAVQSWAEKATGGAGYSPDAS